MESDHTEGLVVNGPKGIRARANLLLHSPKVVQECFQLRGFNTAT